MGFSAHDHPSNVNETYAVARRSPIISPNPRTKLTLTYDPKIA